jgi:hypothetical protein
MNVAKAERLNKKIPVDVRKLTFGKNKYWDGYKTYEPLKVYYLPLDF